MFIRAYLRASTTDQDANRARKELADFAASHGLNVACWYAENESGATLQRPELMRLLADASPGDVLLVEQVDRISRLTDADWQKLRALIDQKGIRIVALDLPTSHMLVKGAVGAGDDFTGRMLSAINGMLLDMLAAIARKDYEDRRRRQAQGIEKAKAAGAYGGRKSDEELHKRVRDALGAGLGIRATARVVGCSSTTVIRIRDLYGMQPEPVTA